MDKIVLLQLGTGGMAWLLFIVGLLWCGFAWWRATRCRSALACVITAITSIVSAGVMVAMLVSELFFRSGSGSGKLTEYLALGFFVLAGVSWAVSSICFLIAAGRSTYPKPEDFSTQVPAPPRG